MTRSVVPGPRPSHHSGPGYVANAKAPDFELADPDTVRWSTGQVRGPRELPLRLLPHQET